MQKPPQIFQRVGHTLQEMSFALIEAAKSVSPQGLQDAHVNVSIVMSHERFAVELHKTSKRLQIMIKQVLTHFRRQVGLGVKQKRSDIVLQGPFATALIVHKKWLAVP